MAKYLRGNYRLRKTARSKTREKKKTSLEEFEQRALEKLGGSIAFVMKPKTFVWTGKNEETE